jgi:hypothetical protein
MNIKTKIINLGHQLATIIIEFMLLLLLNIYIYIYLIRLLDIKTLLFNIYN